MVVDNSGKIDSLRVKMSEYVAAEYVQLTEIKSDLERERTEKILPKSRKNLRRLYRYERRLAKFKEDFFGELEAAMLYLRPEEQEQIERIMLAVIKERIESENKFLNAVKKFKGLKL